MDSLDVPVLFLTYNRLDTVQKSFAPIKAARPTRLYFASDGPKGNAEDEQKVNMVRKWVELEVDWPCEFYKRYSASNQGCKRGVSNAINWIFESEDRAIIIEDDIVVDKSFFGFCREMLERYKDDTRIMTISGDKKVWDYPIEGDYFFSYFSTIWGWATWKRAWNLYDLSMSNWPKFRDEGHMKDFFAANAEQALTKEFDLTYNGELNSWAYPWFFTRLFYSGLGILPKENLIMNVGYAHPDATHVSQKVSQMPVGEFRVPYMVEENVVRNIGYDRAYEKKILKISKLKCFLKKIIPKSILNWRYQFINKK